MSDPNNFRRIEALEKAVKELLRIVRRIPAEQVAAEPELLVYARLDGNLTQNGSAQATVYKVSATGTYTASTRVITVYGNVLIGSGKRLPSSTLAWFTKHRGRWQILAPNQCEEDAS